MRRRIHREQAEDGVEAFHPLSQRFATPCPQQEVKAQIKHPFFETRQIVQQAVDVLLSYQYIWIVSASLAPVEAATRGMSGPVTRELPLHGPHVLRVVVEADVHPLVVKHQRSQPAIERDLTRGGGHRHTA